MYKTAQQFPEAPNVQFLPRMNDQLLHWKKNNNKKLTLWHSEEK